MSSCPHAISSTWSLQVIVTCYPAGKRWPKYNEFTDQDLVDRDKEYLATLRANLENKVVKEVHLFYMEDDDLKVGFI